MKRTGLTIFFCALIVIGGTVMAADVNVIHDGNTHEWSPNPLYINYGDTVIFRNCSYDDFYVIQSMGGCDPWQTSLIGGGAAWGGCGTGPHTFYAPECPENGQEYYYDSYFLSTGSIIYINPTPTPTPTWYYFPSTTPVGLGITLAALGILMLLPALRRHRRNSP